jgi:hypothetical protein
MATPGLGEAVRHPPDMARPLTVATPLQFFIFYFFKNIF